MKRWISAVAVAVVAGAGQAWATYHPNPTPGGIREEDLVPNMTGAAQQVRLSVVQVFFPGVPDRFACRMQVRAINDSHARVSFRALLQTFDSDKAALDSWLIPTGQLDPGQEVLRSYSCRQATSIEVSRVTAYGWPTTCEVDGEEASPCPIELHLTSSLALPPDPNKKKDGKKGE